MNKANYYNELVTTANGSNILIVNPTVYNPDAIIGKYCARVGTDVNSEIQNRVQKGSTNRVAAQDLFTKAVRHHESQRNVNALILGVTGYFLMEGIGTLKLYELLIAAPIMCGIFYVMISLMHYFLVTGILDKLGVNIQYSI